MVAISYQSLPSQHFLNLPRPDIVIGGGDLVDTTTLAAHDFDVDTRTGFMPPDPPLSRLPAEWEPWEATLDRAMSSKLKLASTPNLSREEADKSAAWRSQVAEASISFFLHRSRAYIVAVSPYSSPRFLLLIS